MNRCFAGTEKWGTAFCTGFFMLKEGRFGSVPHFRGNWALSSRFSPFFSFESARRLSNPLLLLFILHKIAYKFFTFSKRIF